jgi:NADH-quinone oxidoreductase subunit E
MLRRLHPVQPATFAFTPANRAWAEAQITKYPPGRQASAIIPLLWRAQEQEGWLTRAAIEHVAEMLGMPYIRVLEVATFYFMFQLAPVGSVAHVQVCGTTSCMICGAEDLVAVCKRRIAARPHVLSADGRFSWEEVECLGACANAPMVQIGKDYYEDLTAERLERILDELAAGRLPAPGPQNGRYASEPLGGRTSLTHLPDCHPEGNASVALAAKLGDTVKRIDGTEVPLTTPWLGRAAAVAPARPAGLPAPRGGVPDDLRRIRGIGPELVALCHRLGYFHFDQIAAWGPAEVAWVDDNLEGFKGCVTRDDWVAQARALAAERS